MIINGSWCGGSENTRWQSNNYGQELRKKNLRKTSWWPVRCQRQSDQLGAASLPRVPLLRLQLLQVNKAARVVGCSVPRISWHRGWRDGSMGMSTCPFKGPELVPSTYISRLTVTQFQLQVIPHTVLSPCGVPTDLYRTFVQMPTHN